MTYKEGLAACKKIGCAHATGDGLRAMYANLIPFHACLAPGTAEKFFFHLQKFGSDREVGDEARRILRDPATVWGIL